MSKKGLTVGSIVFPGQLATQAPDLVKNGISDWTVEHRTCQKCHERPATETWSEGSIAFVHGLFQRWCKRCVVAAQLAHAEEMAARLPSLRAELAALDA